MGVLYGRAGRLNTKNAGFRPGQDDDLEEMAQVTPAELELVAPLAGEEFVSPRASLPFSADSHLNALDSSYDRM
jgi:hypothetical protein